MFTLIITLTDTESCLILKLKAYIFLFFFTMFLRKGIFQIFSDIDFLFSDDSEPKVNGGNSDYKIHLDQEAVEV